MSSQPPAPLELLREYFGHPAFRPSQAGVIDHVMAGRHAMVVMPTGMGKSLCFQIPALALPHGSGQVCVVLSPLIALMKDQVESLVRRGIDATFVNSSLTRQERAARYTRIAAGRFRLIYVTPERFRKPEFREVLGQCDVRLMAVDEAHCVSAWGHDFRPDYTRIQEIRRSLGNPVTIALTATATAQCRDDIYRQLGIADESPRLFHEGIDRPNLSLEVTRVFDEEEKLRRTCELFTDPAFRSGQAVVYFSLIKTLQRFSDHLARRGIDHVCYHGDLSRGERRRVQDEFMSGQADTVLATNAFGMGVDKADIRMVVHAETPGSVESYYQEIGRAGRDGAPSRCVWMYDPEDLTIQMQFIEWSNPDAEFYRRLYEMIRQRGEQCDAFGLDWLNGQLQRVSRHDHRLETALAMLDRHGVIAGPRPPACFQIQSALPDHFCDSDFLARKKTADQKRLYAMVQLASYEGDRKVFLKDYFLGDDTSGP